MNPKNASWYAGGGLVGSLPIGAGTVYYVFGVDGTGSNANDGLSEDSPLLTITYALSLCSQDDVIVVLDYNNPTGETWPISVDVAKVHILGIEGAGTQYPIITPPADTAAFSIAADRVEIGYLCINGGATHGAIENDATAGASRWGLYVHDCWFAVLGTAQDGIKNVASGDMPYLRVERCRFGFAITRDGIRIEHNATRCQIGSSFGGSGNLFDRVQGVGVNVVGNAADIGIQGNRFVIPANTAGAAITLSAGTAGSVIFDNIANFGDTDMGNNPYTDGAGAGSNHWGANYQGVTLTQPA